MFNVNEFDSHTKKEYSDAILSHLKSKYGESFEIDSMGGEYGTNDDTTVKAWCYSNEGKFKNVKFMASVGKERLEVEDAYINLFAADNFSLGSENKIFAIDDVVVLSVFETPDCYSALNNKDVSITDFAASVDKIFVTTYVFLKNNNESLQSKTDRVYEIGQNFASSYSIADQSILVYFLNDFNENEINELYYKNYDNKYNFFENISIKESSAGCSIKNGVLISDKENILKSFEGGN